MSSRPPWPSPSLAMFRVCVKGRGGTGGCPGLSSCPLCVSASAQGHSRLCSALVDADHASGLLQRARFARARGVGFVLLSLSCVSARSPASFVVGVRSESATPFCCDVFVPTLLLWRGERALCFVRAAFGGGVVLASHAALPPGAARGIASFPPSTTCARGVHSHHSSHNTNRTRLSRSLSSSSAPQIEATQVLPPRQRRRGNRALVCSRARARASSSRRRRPAAGGETEAHPNEPAQRRRRRRGPRAARRPPRL
jgi:hypothetical protein